MKFDKWVSTFKGHYLDYDGAYGVQCVDLIKHYIRNVLGFEPQSIGNAIDYYRLRHTSPYLLRNFKWIDNSDNFIPHKGDIGVFKTSSRYGHIVVCNGVGNKYNFQAYDENHNGTHAPMTLRTFEYSGSRRLLGVLRPYNQSNIQTVEGWQMDDNGWYYVRGGSMATNQWIQDTQGWLYLDENGRIATNQWKKDSIGWLYLGEDGHPMTDQWIQDSVGWCYVDSDGYAKTNAWQQDSKGWCFIKDDGHLLYDGYAWDNTGKHYLDSTGHMEW